MAIRIAGVATLIALSFPSRGILAQSTQPAGSPDAAASPTADASADPLASPESIVMGEGPFDLLDPAVGLEAMTDYVATLTVSFSGTQAGAPLDGSTSATWRSTPEGHELTIDRGPDGPTTYRAEIAGTAYAKDGDAPCTAEPSAEGESLADLYAPAEQLPRLIGADEAGIETIEGTPAHHYTFDERAMVLANRPKASGDIWVADTGGYVVRYLLTVDAGPEYFGEDTTGTRTLEYALRTSDSAIGTDIPADCPVPLDAPLLTDATDVVNLPGILSFHIRMNLAEATKSYATLLEARGWKPTKRPNVTKASSLAEFRKGRTKLTVLMREDGGSIAVQVVAIPATRSRG